jgi:hypothetical protein
MKKEPSKPLPPELPEGVSLADWSLEKVRWQNPRIRSFLGCIRVLDEVFESNYAILNCSPRRLMILWGEVRKVASAIRTGIAPLLKGRSVIPALEEARGASELYLTILDEKLLKQIDSFPQDAPEHMQDELRRLLCVAVGQLHSFLLDTLGEILAADPRSQHDADYFLARRFARDVDEAEWLHTSVGRLERYLAGVVTGQCHVLAKAISSFTSSPGLPSEAEWEAVKRTLRDLEEGLVNRLKKVVGLRGIRLSELELLDGYTTRIPALCTTLDELRKVAAATARHHKAAGPSGDDSSRGTAQEAAPDPALIHICERMTALLSELRDQLSDLVAFVSVWRKNIEHRRALMLGRRENG